MPLGMEVGLSPGEFVLDGKPDPPQKGVGALSPILMVEVQNFEIGLEVPRGTSVYSYTFVVLEQQIILVKTRSESV